MGVGRCLKTGCASKEIPGSGGEDFFDTNVVRYLRSADAAKADKAEELLALGGTISVQVLNEFVAVDSRKLRMSWIREVLTQIRAVCVVEPLTVETHEHTVRVAERYRLSRSSPA